MKNKEMLRKIYYENKQKYAETGEYWVDRNTWWYR